LRRLFAVVGALFVCACQRKAARTQDYVSYGRQIAPIFALHCNGCHSGSAPSSQFRTADYRGLLAGGVLGGDVVSRFPDRSMLVKFIEGFRGPDQRMPLNSQPLSSDQINLIRRWIAEGALNDHAVRPCYKLRLLAVNGTAGQRLLIHGKVSATASLVLFIRDQNHQVLHTEETSVKQPPEQMDGGAPGDLLAWTINYETTWSPRVEVELVVRYASEAVEASLTVQNEHETTLDAPLSTRKVTQSQCMAD
jgi:hypothetical protein